MLDARGHGLSDPFYRGVNGETLLKDVVEFDKLETTSRVIKEFHPTL